MINKNPLDMPCVISGSTPIEELFFGEEEESEKVPIVAMWYDGTNAGGFCGWVVGWRVHYPKGTQYTGKPGTESEPISEYWFDTSGGNYATFDPPAAWMHIPPEDSEFWKQIEDSVPVDKVPILGFFPGEGYLVVTRHDPESLYVCASLCKAMRTTVTKEPTETKSDGTLGYRGDDDTVPDRWFYLLPVRPETAS